MKNLILVNFKTYKQGSFDNALRLAKICNSVSENFKKEIWIAAQAADIYRISKNVKIKVFAQHIDPIEAERNTGFIEASNLKLNGAYGVLLNHSEHKLKFFDLKKAVNLAKKCGLKVVVCAANPSEVNKVKILKPDYIAIEPPELIASNTSVSRARPEVITSSIRLTKIKILCGAGIKTKEDVKKAVALGARGILVSSGIVLSKNPKKVLSDMAQVI